MNFQLRHFLAALALHVVLFGAMFVGVIFQHRVPPAPVMEASLIEDPRIARAKALEQQQEELRRIEEEQQKKLEEEKKKLEEEKKPTPEELARQEEQKKKLREQEEVKKQEQLKLKAEAERKRQEENKKKQEAERQKREAEAEMKKALDEERQRELDEEKRVAEELKRKREAEAKAARDAILAAQRAEEEARLGGKRASWGQAIAARIRRFSEIPPGSPSKFTCQVEIAVTAGATDVTATKATVTRSCGSPQLDRAVEKAVIRANPLPAPADPAAFVPNILMNYCWPNESACQ